MLELPPKIGFYVWIPIFFAFIYAMKVMVLEPTQKLLDERAKRTTGAQADAEQMRDAAAEMQAEFDRKLAEARMAGNTAGEQVRREAEASEHNILEQARGDAAHLVDEVRGRIEAETETARGALRADADALSKLVAEKVLGRAMNS
ncbi:MAG: ATP synthase F0 subunit B [Candidatus Binatia bacterium]|nr:ATP synthase F0 subunit B [Candidatus Binatia bacterium]